MAGHSRVSFSSDTAEKFSARFFHALSAGAAFCMLVCCFSPRTEATPAPPRFSGTYLQLLDRHSEWGTAEWEDLFGDFEKLGLSKLVLQWSVSADLAFYPSKTFRHGKNPPLESILKLADARGIEVQVGLWHDPNFWRNISGPDDLLEAYLRNARYRSILIARELAPLLQRHRCFHGWYISEEIDDSGWNEPARRRLLLEHLASLATALRALSPADPVGISGFSGAHLAPDSLEAFWEEILKSAPIGILYFQDGIGTGKLELPYLPLYLSAVKRAADRTGCRLSVVVELFDQRSGADDAQFRAVSAPWSRVERQMVAASRYAADAITAFSVPDYMSSTGGADARHLFEDYLHNRMAAGSEP